MYQINRFRSNRNSNKRAAIRAIDFSYKNSKVIK